MTSAGWWYCISMVALGASMSVMLWASTPGVRQPIIIVLALLSAAYWGLAAFGSAGSLRSHPTYDDIPEILDRLLRKDTTAQ